MNAHSQTSTVWVGRATEADAVRAIRTALQNLGVTGSSAHRSVVIKINICDYRRCESGATTDPKILGALLTEAQRLWPAAELSVVENDATSLDVDSAYRMLGFSAVASKHGAVLRNVATEPWIRKAVPNGRYFTSLDVPAIVDACDVFINFAKLKTNALTKTTGCLKNIFGLLHQKRKVALHGSIDAVLVDMNSVIRQDICLVDGIVGMEGIGGPAFGKPKRCNLIIAGRNPVSVDACGARIMGFRPRSIRHIRLCARNGLGSINYHLTSDIASFRYRDYKFRFQQFEFLLRHVIRSRAGFEP